MLNNKFQFLLIILFLGIVVSSFKDEISDAEVTLSFEHHEVHEGDAFVFSVDSGALADGDTLGVLVVTPNTDKVCHMVYDVEGALDTKFQIWENATHANGTAYSTFNRNRNSSNTATTLVYDMGAGAVAGTRIFTSHFGVDAGIGVGAVTGGGGTRGETEILLKKNTKYLFAIMSLTDNNVVSMKLHWYEHIAISER